MKGSCLCGDVSFEVTGAVGALTACHCAHCRKQSGHYWAAARVPSGEVAIHGDVRWYRASPEAARGFCPTCGSLMFWRHKDEAGLSFSPAAIDGPTGLRLSKHRYTAFKGDYYEIGDGLPQELGEDG